MNQKKDKIRFAQVMAALGEVFDSGRETSALKTEIYFKALERFQIEEIEKASSMLIGTRTTASFPKPAEIIGCIKPKAIESRIDKLEAWGMVMSGLEMGRLPNDNSIQETIRRLGGWNYLQDKSYDELHWIEKRFIEHYEQILESDKHDLIDWCEEAKMIEENTRK
jgi:hypothetical protein